MPSRSSKQPSFSWRFILLGTYLAAVFLLGGGARDDIQSLVLLRPLAALVGGVALLGLTRDAIASHRFLFAMAAALILWFAIQLVPLPPALWGALPGRELIVSIDAAIGLDGHWRPLSIDPRSTANALAALLVPAPVLLLAAHLDERELQALVPLVLAIALATMLIAVVQISGNGPYFYRITNTGAGVGLFANRNHQAAFLAAAFPLLAVYAQRKSRPNERDRLRAAAAAAMAVVLIPLILVTGSRLGLILGVLGLAVAAVIWRFAAPPTDRARDKSSSRLALFLGLSVLLVVAILAVVFSRAEAVSRLLADDQTGDLRLKAWGPVWRTGVDYFPVGSGSGSFVTAFKQAEPDGLVRPTYLNHAHNDLLEVFVTDGLVGLALLAAAIGWVALRSHRAWFGSGPVNPAKVLGRAASAVLGLLILASVTDYPLRVPSLACFAVLAAIWLSGSTGGQTTKAVDVSGRIG